MKGKGKILDLNDSKDLTTIGVWLDTKGLLKDYPQIKKTWWAQAIASTFI